MRFTYLDSGIQATKSSRTHQWLRGEIQCKAHKDREKETERNIDIGLTMIVRVLLLVIMINADLVVVYILGENKLQCRQWWWWRRQRVRMFWTLVRLFVNNSINFGGRKYSKCIYLMEKNLSQCHVSILELWTRIPGKQKRISVVDSATDRSESKCIIKGIFHIGSG